MNITTINPNINTADSMTPNTKARIDSIVQKLDDDCFNLVEELMQLRRLYPLLKKEENAKYFIEEYLDWAEKIVRDQEYEVPEDVRNILMDLIDKMW